jgi:PRTRC genetic system ThiF family protein
MSGSFDPNTHIITVTIVGVGGTGASTARIVARIIYDMQRSRKHTPQLVLIDLDRVEEKNIGRQALFAPSDIGQYKAEVVGRRLNFALGLGIAWICEPISATQHFDRYGGNLVISCVDNHEARKEIHRVNGILIGSGNHEDAGQVCIGNTGDLDLMRRHLDAHSYDGLAGKVPYLPKEGLLFPDLLQPESPRPAQAVSCGEMVANGDQHLLVNDAMATIVGQYVCRLLHRQPIGSFLTYVSIGEMPSIRSLPICREELEVFLGGG